MLQTRIHVPRVSAFIISLTTVNSHSDRVAGYRLTRRVGPKVTAIRCGEVAITVVGGKTLISENTSYRIEAVLYTSL
ncbi:hypothetical protein F5141DRAFT_1074743 [Pisolithus sp. B1]|nr:hypothetical protein F5141DRAFT_1074743 [Pisolithus sp. B1]